MLFFYGVRYTDTYPAYTIHQLHLATQLPAGFLFSQIIYSKILHVMKCIYCVLLLLCSYAGNGQSMAKGLGIGERLPAIKANNVLNHTSGYINTADYKGKLLVLDFMRTTCGGCLSKLEAYEQLQQQYNGKLFIVLVTKESPAVVKAYMKHPTAKKLRFPIITADEKLSKLFPHESLSHLVWIGTDGIVKAITEGDYVTAVNVETALTADELLWPVKRDIPFFDNNAPLLITGQQVEAYVDKPMAHIAMLPYLPDVVSNHTLAKVDTSGSIMNWRFLNLSIIDIYTRLYRKFHFALSRVLLYAKNKNRFFYQEDFGPYRAWKEKYALSFEAGLPKVLGMQHNIRSIHRGLDSFLGLQTSFDTIKVSCLLIAASNSQRDPVPENEGVTLWQLQEFLNAQLTARPVILAHDSLNFQRVRIKLNNPVCENYLLQQLQAEGYDAKMQTRETEMFLIKEL